jgi:hypothetical protein
VQLLCWNPISRPLLYLAQSITWNGHSDGHSVTLYGNLQMKRTALDCRVRYQTHFNYRVGSRYALLMIYTGVRNCVRCSSAARSHENAMFASTATHTVMKEMSRHLLSLSLLVWPGSTHFLSHNRASIGCRLFEFPETSNRQMGFFTA